MNAHISLDEEIRGLRNAENLLRERRAQLERQRIEAAKATYRGYMSRDGVNPPASRKNAGRIK